MRFQSYLLAQSERLGRGISSSKHFDRFKKHGICSIKIFIHRNRRKLSVDRLNDDNLSSVCEIAKKREVDRGRTFYGWASVTEDVASSNGRTIADSPQVNNPFHADIVLPACVLTDKKAMEEHATELAANAQLQLCEA